MEKEKKPNVVMSFSPARSQPDSMSMSPGTRSPSPLNLQESQSTKWPPSPDHASISSEIAAEAKAKLHKWSTGPLNEEPVRPQIPAPQKTKFVPKVSPKFDARQAALNKIASRRLALAKSKAAAGIGRVGVKPATVNTEPVKTKDSKVVEATPAMKISIKSFGGGGVVTSSSADKINSSACASTTSADVSSSNDVIHNEANVKLATVDAKRPTSEQMRQSMQATLEEHTSAIGDKMAVNKTESEASKIGIAIGIRKP